jgi:signal recognition particle subunit SRP54
MFDGLSRSLEKAWDTVRKDGKLNADNIKEPLREIRRASGCWLRPTWSLC